MREEDTKGVTTFVMVGTRPSTVHGQFVPGYALTSMSLTVYKRPPTDRASQWTMTLQYVHDHINTLV